MSEGAITEQELEHGYGRNGDGNVSFPLDSFYAAAEHLRRPFTAAAVKFKVQATWPKDDPTGGLIVSYIDARLVVERLNLLVPHLWHDEYEATQRGLMWCALTIDGITRRDVGEGDGKGLVSDALKRAAVKFGIGVSLYATPKMILNKGEHLKAKRTGRGPTLELTPNGETHVRGLYASWLDADGIKAFGQPLDHGDVEGAQGDPDAIETEAEEASEPASAPDPQLTEGEVLQLYTLIEELGWGEEEASIQLAAAGAQDTSDIRTAIRTLSRDQALALIAKVTAKVAGESVEGGEAP